MSDPFNWPFPSRKDLMSLSKINDNDIGLLPRRTFQNTFSTSLLTSDISGTFLLLEPFILQGAQPNRRAYRFTHKTSYVNRNDDIIGSSPKKLHQKLHKRYFNLTNEDICQSRPQCNKFVTKRKPSNPLNPVYKLAYAEVRTATPPRFIRDQINIDDIDGSKPNPYVKYNINRKTNEINDIDGARPSKIKLRQDFIGMQLNVRDINEYMEFKTKRVVNPLEPIYHGVNDKGEPITYGRIKGSKPKRLHPVKVNKVESMFLNTGDIKGAQTFTLSDKFYKKKTRKDFRRNTLTDDIPGAQAGTLKRGITTKRCSNPIMPNYIPLGIFFPQINLTFLRLW